MGAFGRKLLPFLAPRLAYLYIRLLHATMRLTYVNRETLDRLRAETGGYILAFWHSRYVLMPYGCEPRRIAALLSMHQDSRMLGQILERFGVQLAFGSSTRGGLRGMRQALRMVRSGLDLGIAPDGPKGPRRRVKPGVIVAARLTGLPIVPVSFSARPARRLGSWDRTVVPAPFAAGRFVYGEPIHVARAADEDEQERLRARLEVELDRVTDLADEGVGLGLEEARPPVEA